MTYRAFLLVFNFKLDMLQRNEYLCSFSLDMIWGKCNNSFYLPFAANINSIKPNLLWHQYLYSPEEVNKPFAQSNIFFPEIIKVPKLLNITNWHIKRHYELTYTKGDCSRIKKDKAILTKTKFKAKQPAKIKKQKIFVEKKN